jgi:predicted enzyme related to lactoylglutathione lyase
MVVATTRRADQSKNPSGASTVAYWSVHDLERSRDAFIEAGREPLRGPYEVSPTRRICQLVDPFGTVFGLDVP